MRRCWAWMAVPAVASAVLYRTRVKAWQERWGATDEELELVLPGDELVAEPAEQVTRAITIEAPPEQVWPWLVQIGADRGGFYSYDWLENLFGLGIHSADALVPEWQERAVGHLVHANAAGTGGWYVMESRPPEALVLATANVPESRPVRRDDPAGWEFLWTFALRPGHDGTTRLLARERVAFGRTRMRLLMAPVGVISFVMTRKMLYGIKERAEGPRRRLA